MLNLQYLEDWQHLRWKARENVETFLMRHDMIYSRAQRNCGLGMSVQTRAYMLTQYLGLRKEDLLTILRDFNMSLPTGEEQLIAFRANLVR